MVDNEMFVNEAKDEYGEKIIVREYFYPFVKNNQRFLLKSDSLYLLPVKIEETQKVAIEKKGYYIITKFSPRGFGASKTFDSFKHFVDSFCDYTHTNDKDFIIWKIIAIMSYISRLNVRVATNPAFGKDSVFKVLNAFLGDIGIVHNPTIAKLEWLLPNRVIVTNEVGGIKSTDKYYLEQFYLTCGDFSNQYEKRSRAILKGSHDKYDIHKLSNIVCYNRLEDYPLSSQDKYYDMVFNKAVRERFLPLKLNGKITEKFSLIKNPEILVKENKKVYKEVIKYLKYLQDHFEDEVKDYKKYNFEFKDRMLRNWETICTGLNMYASDENEYKDLVIHTYKRFCDYINMVKRKNTVWADQGQPELSNFQEEKVI
jgi:hypothetical protein